ncbi:MAG: MBL fold metallo-hydrolase [Oscillospiraceae bacterium]|nr:MBL fold metallo-hydrolase [Oscillospiraceae bacterium]
MNDYLRIILPLIPVGLAIAGGIALYCTYPLMAMKPIATGPVPSTPVLALRSRRGALYLIDTGAGWLLIDAGTNAEEVSADLAGLGVDPAQVNWILLTHSDYDHVASLPLFPNAVIHMGEAELALVASGKKKLPEGIDPNAIRLVRDGEKLMFDNTQVECVAAPGHTDGSTAYLVDNTYLFTGDALRWHTLRSGEGKMSVHPYKKGNKAETLASLEKLKGLAGKYMVFTSHYGVIPKN